MGSILENIYAQILTANGFTLRYFDKKGKCELDFLIQKGDKIYPIEIKSGNSYKSHASLDFALQNKTWDLTQGYVFCSGNVETEGEIVYLPWYMVMFLQQNMVSRGNIVEVDLSGLQIR